MRGESRLDDEEREFLAKVVANNPLESSCKALLKELMSAEVDQHRFLAAECLGQLKCKECVRELGNLARDLADNLGMPQDGWGFDLPGRKQLESVLWALGRIDTSESQGILAELLNTSPNPIVRADVMEYMAYGRRFAPEIVWPFASIERSVPEILSALYALEFQPFKMSPEELEQRLEPLLNHDYPLVAAYCVNLLRLRPQHRGLIESLKDDPREVVRQEVADALRMMDSQDFRRPTN